MEENNIYNRADALINEYTNFIESIKCRQTEDCVTLRHIIDLKSVLANINNVITLLATHAVAYKIAEAFEFSEAETHRLIGKINEVGPNTNGYDIQIDDPKILVEVKCNKLIDGKFGAAQLKSMQNDILKLLEPSPEKHKKTYETIKSTKEYLKILTLVNFDDISAQKLVEPLTKEVKCKEGTSEDRKKRKGTWKHVKLLEGSLPSCVPSDEKEDKVYILVLAMQDLEYSLNKILAK